MNITDKAALNAAVRALRESLLANDPQIFESLKFNTLHQIFARLCGYRTQAALLNALPARLDINTGGIESELFRTWSVTGDSDRARALDSFAASLNELKREQREPSYALIQIDLLFGVSHLLQCIDVEQDDHESVSKIDWRSLIESVTGISVHGGIALRDGEWSPNGFGGREEEFRAGLDGRDLDVEFHEFVNTGRALDPEEADEHGWSWVPQCFTRSCLLFASIDGLQTSEPLECDIEMSVLSKLRSYFHRQLLIEPDAPDPYVDSHLLCGQIRVVECPKMAGDDEEDRDEAEFHDILVPNMDYVGEEFYECDFISIGALGESGSATSYVLEEWMSTCFSEGKVAYPEVGIALVSNGWPVGFVGQWREELILALYVYERTGTPDAMNYSSNHGFGGQFLAGNPKTKLYFFDLEDDEKFFMEADDALGHFVDGHVLSTVHPALFGKFGESIKHLPEGIEPAYNPDRPAFDTLGQSLINGHGVSCVVVDDFLDDWAAMTSALIVGLYRGDQLVAEFSYCVLKQNPEMRGPEGGSCAELELDEVIKSWCKSKNLPLYWNEHEVLRPIGPRKLSRFESDAAFLPTAPSEYIYNSTLAVAVVIDGIEPFEVESERFQKAMSEMYEHCIPGGDPFDFRVLSLRETSALPSSLSARDLKAAVAHAFERPSNHQVSVEPGMVLLGGYNLRGTSRPEIISSVNNTWLSQCVFEEGDTPIMNRHAARLFLEKLGAEWNEQATVRIDFVGFNAKAVFKGIFHDL